jgi:hypothetical protein
VSARRVFVSHTSELGRYPPGRSFVRAAIDGVLRAGHAVCDMSYFTARDQQPAKYCVEQVAASDVYLGLIGFRYGSPVRDQPEFSYTQLEFQAATTMKRERLVFLLDEDADELGLPGKYCHDPNADYHARQQAFRDWLSANVGVVKRVGSAQELEMLVHQALVDVGRAPQERRPSAGEALPGAGWGAGVIGKADKRWKRDLILRLSHGDHRLTYKESVGGCDIFIDGSKVADLSTMHSGTSASIRRQHRAWRRWVVPVDDGPTRLPVVIAAEIAVTTNKLLSLHVSAGQRLLYAEGNAPPLTGWKARP